MPVKAQLQSRRVCTVWRLAVLGGLLSLPFAGDSANLVQNPGFEEIRDGKLVDWSLGGISDGGHAVLDASTERPKAGRYCAHLKGDAEWAAVNSSRIPVRAGKRYELRAFVRAAKGHGYVKFDYFKDNHFLGMTSDDYAYEGVQIGSISGVLPTNEQPFKYSVNVIGLSYVVTF